jgi:SAM-dependent methyltransferase
MKKNVSECLICLNCNTQEYSHDKFRKYLICSQCELIFVPRNQLIPPDAEKQRYDSHQNDENDPQYKNYLTQIMNQIVPELEKQQSGLDFGCGRTDLLAQLFRDNNFLLDSFDLYFLPDEKIWTKKYDFIILSEVIEHLRDPVAELEKLRKLLFPNGKILIKTMLHPGEKYSFDNWFYKRDSTHVQFFNSKSLSELGKKIRISGPRMISKDLAMFTAS